eukprot:TRINITY_DN3138_c0_g1_i2.p1 TRINITY_DN3138_c0_g1~~TRINITY_DN3138_c0_g1_i2.p1  ORF type:complete len:239 (-),score=15.46 TRINITY_DN3138_c0_g1_i2:106-756(-)
MSAVGKISFWLLVMQCRSARHGAVVRTTSGSNQYTENHKMKTAACGYVDPGQYLRECNKSCGGFPDMEKLENDPTILAYAYGPPFAGRNVQVMVWSYDRAEQKVWMWFAKPGQLTRCDGAKGSQCARNIPTSGGKLGTCQACPSCKDLGTNMGFRGGCSMEGGPAFPLQKPFVLGPYGSYHVLEKDGKFVMANSKGRILKRIFACSARQAALKFED